MSQRGEVSDAAWETNSTSHTIGPPGRGLSIAPEGCVENQARAAAANSWIQALVRD